MNKLKYSLIVLFLALHFQCFSQNMVANWSFEDTIPCISNPNFGLPETAPPWVTSSQSPDYFSEIYCGSNQISFGYQAPKTGEAFVGIATFNTIAPNGIREVFSQQLSDSLIQGHKYCISFYVSLAESSIYAIDKIGALFTSFPIDGIYVYSFNGIPQVYNTSGTILFDTLNWTMVSGDFIAQGNEQYISIGNFYNDSNTQFMQLPWGTLNFAYYYVDDISVFDCTVGIEELYSQNFVVYPNPVYSNQLLTLEFSSTPAEEINIQILSDVGQLVFESKQITSKKIELSFSLSPGIYYIKVSNDLWHKHSKIVVINEFY